MWTIMKRNRAGQFVAVLEVSAGIGALKAFDSACDTGSPGDYLLRGGDVDLATAKVQKDEYCVTWRKPWIFYAMGHERIPQGLDAMWDYLAER